MFDSYSLKARVYPMVILLLPVLIIGISFSLQFDSVVHFASSVGVLGVLTFLLSQLGRDLGKSKEKDLWESWGGAPSTQLLRLHNGEIDSNTKKRYHEKLNKMCPIERALDAAKENADAKYNDETYRAWTKFLIAKTRDHNVFHLLLKENTNYGFRRNLWALKPYGLAFLILTWICMYLYTAQSHADFTTMSFPTSFWYASIGLASLLALWIIIVTDEWVKLAAFAYAHRLCESIDEL